MARPGLADHRGLECRLSLAAMLSAVVAARNHERQLQGRPGVSPFEVTRLRTITLGALEAYAQAIDSLAWPVPRVVLQDIRLRRALLAPPSPPTRY